MIFSGQASDGSIYTDQGKRPDQTKSKNKNYHSKSSERKQEKIRKKQKRKQADDEPFNRQEV